MAQSADTTIIKKYANRRLYHTGTSTYVTLDDLADMVRRGEQFVVQDAKTGEDITRGVLGQIIFDAESRGKGLLPIAFLRQLITFYGDQMQTLVPAYLEHSLAAFASEQERMRKQVNQKLGAQAYEVMEDQVRRNMDLFQRSMRMFMPFDAEQSRQNGPQQNGDPLAQDVAALRGELAKMQARIDALAARPSADEGKDAATGSEAAHPEDEPAPRRATKG